MEMAAISIPNFCRRRRCRRAGSHGKMEGCGPFDDLPVDLLGYLLGHASLTTRLSFVYSVCRRLRLLGTQEHLWSAVHLLDCQVGCSRYADALTTTPTKYPSSLIFSDGPSVVLSCPDTRKWPVLAKKCLRLRSLDVSPETNHDLPLADLKKLIKAAPLLTKLRVAYIKNINATFVRLVATQCPLLEVFDVNAGGMVKGLGPGGEAALLELAGKCRRLRFLRVAPAKEFRLGDSVRQLALALPAGCVLTNNGWMSGLRPSNHMPGAPNGYGSPPQDDLPEWHDFGRFRLQSSNNPLGTTESEEAGVGTRYVQCGPLAPRMKPEYDTLEEWRTHNPHPP